MNFRRHLKATRPFDLNLTPLIDVIFQLLLFFMLSSTFTTPSAIDVKLPKAVTSDTVKENNITIVVTSENIVYYNDKVVTLTEIRDILDRPHNRGREVLIKADRRASVGRIVDVWDMGRAAGVERINVATDQDR